MLHDLNIEKPVKTRIVISTYLVPKVCRSSECDSSKKNSFGRECLHSAVLKAVEQLLLPSWHLSCGVVVKDFTIALCSVWNTILSRRIHLEGSIGIQLCWRLLSAYNLTCDWRGGGNRDGATLSLCSLCWRAAAGSFRVSQTCGHWLSGPTGWPQRTSPAVMTPSSTCAARKTSWILQLTMRRSPRRRCVPVLLTAVVPCRTV